MNDIKVMLICCRNARAAVDAVEDMPPEVKVLELPCSGRVDEVTIVRALRLGASAVMVAGCLEGNCQHHSGNYQARRRVDDARSILAQIGVEPERVEMLHLASNQSAKARAAVQEMVARARRLGPITLTEGKR
ncbi:hydrogenase iron-sulfur subunit [Methanomassiliicoccus luminyensis]|uniref:hydrogenase iron-sulfur subunit n=1 Tax=Methanomassiliicoccus luminyensis TaxID=1080712 RepID=UPI0003669ECA|nr:hydrogenase iron-sulfur subunit [Methanomassiliicoccus luminyensis]